MGGTLAGGLLISVSEAIWSYFASRSLNSLQSIDLFHCGQ
jgi:hypothetical protein